MAVLKFELSCPEATGCGQVKSHIAYNSRFLRKVKLLLLHSCVENRLSLYSYSGRKWAYKYFIFLGAWQYGVIDDSII